MGRPVGGLLSHLVLADSGIARSNLKVTFWSHVSHEVGVTSAAGTA